MMDPRGKRIAAVGLILSVVLAALGQYYLAFKVDLRWDGVFLYALAMLLFCTASSRLEAEKGEKAAVTSPGLWQRFLQIVRRHGIRSVVAIVGVVAVLYVTHVASRRPQNQPFWDLLVLWLLGVAFTVGAFAPWHELPTHLRESWHRLKSHSVEVTLLAIVTVTAFLLRFVQLERIPFILAGDEAAMGLEAVDVLVGGRASPFVTGWFANPTLYFFLQAVFVRLLGTTATALRLSSVLVSTATVVLLYLLVKHFWGWWVGLLAAIILACYHYAIHFGRMGINNIWDPFLAVGAFYFFIRGLEARRIGPLLTAGLFVGTSFYFSAGSRLMSIVLATYFLYWLIRDRSILRGNLAHLAILGLVIVVVVLPLFAFFAKHPDDMMAPWQRKAIFASGWVADQVEHAGRSVVSILADQFLKSALAFNSTLDPSPFYHPPIPLLQFIPSILFVFGLAYAVRHIGRREYFLLVAWFFLVVLFGGVLLENPPASHRFLLAIPPVVTCTALGITRLVAYARGLLNESPGVGYGISLALVLLLSYQSVAFYFDEYTPSHVYGGPNTEIGDRMGKYLYDLGPDYACYFFGAPRMYYSLPNISYLAQDTVGVDIEQKLTDQVDFVNGQCKAVFVFLPERLEELGVVQRSYPTGRLQEFRNSAGQVLFVSYEADR